MDSYRSIIYEAADTGTIVRILLNRPQVRNAQSRGLLVELNDAMLRAEADDKVRVIILGGVGSAFSSGHDLASPEAVAERAIGPTRHLTYLVNGGTRQGVEQRTLQEWHHFFQYTLRWRNLRKITIAQVNGPVLAGGLMLAWACDLIVAADDTIFADVVATRVGLCGTEYFAHPWELGPRRAKELLLTGDSIDANEAHAIGMVSKVFARDDLELLTMEFARRVAALPTMTSLSDQGVRKSSCGQHGFLQRTKCVLLTTPVEPRSLGSVAR